MKVFFGTPHYHPYDGCYGRDLTDLVFDITLASTEPERFARSRREMLTSIITTGQGALEMASRRFNGLIKQYPQFNIFEELTQRAPFVGEVVSGIELLLRGVFLTGSIEGPKTER